MDNTLEKWRNRWDIQGVRILVLTSLSIQIGLMFLAPLRKRSRNKVLALTIWLLYLSAELVPPLAVGNMGKQKDPADSGDRATIPDDLTILWAPFLLLHLGGPDNITSYSTDDNELWWRLPLGLVVQLVAAVYAFWQSPPNPELWIPTILVCIAGMIKFVERTLALRSGSRKNMKNETMSEISPENDTKRGKVISDSIRNSKIEEIEENLNCEDELSESEMESQYICEGYLWFDIFKRLLVDVNFSSNLLMQSQDRFSDCSAREAINLIALELSFLYDILHTKAIHKHSNLGRVLHCCSLVSIIAALVVFHHLDMQQYASKDITITYILFGAGLAFEVIATLLLVSSDWTVVSPRKKGWKTSIARAIRTAVKRITFRKGKIRWSRCIGQYSIIGLCLRDRYTPRTWIMKKLNKLKHKWDNMCETRSIPLMEKLEEHMFTEAIRRAQNMHTYNVFLKARSYRGRKALEHHGQLQTLEWSMKREFNECIILWHLATDICYYNETLNQPKGNDDTERETSNQPKGNNDTEGETSNQPKGNNDTERETSSNQPKGNNETERETSNQPNGENQDPSNQPNGVNQEPSNQPNGRTTLPKRKVQPNEKIDERDVSWMTSNYMVYLLTQQQSMMQLGYCMTRFEATFAVIKKKFEGKGKFKDEKAREELMKDEFPGQNDAQVSADGHQPTNKTGTLVLKNIWAYLRCWGRRKREEDKPKRDEELLGESVFKDGLRLAEELQKVDQQIRWKLISETWMEMLGYAAIHCDSYQHAKTLTRGGELLTHLWLLMSQLGMVEEHKRPQFEDEYV